MKIYLLAIVLLLSGCAGWKMPYPESWAALSTVNNFCSSFSGEYRAISVPHPGYNKTSCEPAIGKGWFCRSLPEELLGLKSKVTDETWVAIIAKDDTDLEITIGEKNTIQHKAVLRSKDKQFECNEDGLVLKIGPEFMSEDGAIGANLGYQYTFRKALDGSLIMKETTSGGGLAFLLIPVAGSSIQWWKWEPINH